MKLATRTITILVALNLVITNFCLAQTDVSDKPPTFTISGSIGVGGVMMTGLPGNPVSDENGFYSVTVGYGWSGIVEPAREGYLFEPPQRRYNHVTNNVASDYTPKLIILTISGKTGIGGVMLRGLPGDPVSDENGGYSVKVPFGWAGVVAPSKEGFVFVPESVPYLSVFEDQPQQNYRPKRIRPASMAGFAGGRKVLVVPNTDINPEELDAITQDLQVMSQILDEKFKQPQMPSGVFADFGDFFGRDSRDTEATYLQGYGVLFLMEVDFAISPAPPQEQDEEPRDVDPVWQNARRKVFSPRTPGAAARGFEGQQSVFVEMKQLQKGLVETLKHTANIRYLKPDEQVIVTVIGRSSIQDRQVGYGIVGDGTPMFEDSVSESTSSSYSGGYAIVDSHSSAGGTGGDGYRSVDVRGGGYGGGMSRGMGRGDMGGYGGGGRGGFMSRYGEVSFSSPIVLTIRAKKSDVDLFAANELDLEMFREKIQIFTY